MAETATSLRRGLAILLALGEGQELGVTGIAEIVGREKSQVSRTLKVLADHGLVERDSETLGYRLGWKLFAVAALAGDRRLADLAPRALRELVDGFGESAHLSVLRSDGVLTVISESPARGLQAVNWVGRTVPAGCTSAGYALLVDRGRDELERHLPAADLRVLHPRAPQSADELEERVAAARSRGYAVAEEDFEPGLVAVAAPVRDFRGHVVAAVNVSAPRFRFAARLDEAGTAVRSAAEALSRALGWQANAGSMLDR